MPTRNHKRAPRTKSKADIARTIELMTEQYGPFTHEARLPPTDEMVFTILSQHTSDINSSRAFRRLMETFTTLDGVAAADVADAREISLRVYDARPEPHFSGCAVGPH